jgi:hypothetical protein
MPILSHLSHLSLGLPSHLSYALLPCPMPPIHPARQRPCDSAPLSVRLSPTSPSIYLPTAAAPPRVPLVSGAAGSVAGGGAGLPLFRAPHPEF